METKTFGDKKIIIREINNKDLKNAKKFQDFVNSLVSENAKVSMAEKINLKEQKEWINGVIKAIKNKSSVYLIAEHNGQVVGSTDVKQCRGRQNHIGSFGIAIKNGYRGIGLGEHLAKEVIALAQKRFKPSPKIIKLEVLINNEPAQGLYKKIGFKEVARVPKQIQYNGELIDEFVMLLEL